MLVHGATKGEDCVWNFNPAGFEPPKLPIIILSPLWEAILPTVVPSFLNNAISPSELVLLNVETVAPEFVKVPVCVIPVYAPDTLAEGTMPSFKLFAFSSATVNDLKA